MALNWDCLLAGLEEMTGVGVGVGVGVDAGIRVGFGVVLFVVSASQFLLAGLALASGLGLRVELAFGSGSEEGEGGGYSNSIRRGRVGCLSKLSCISASNPAKRTPSTATATEPGGGYR